MSIGPISSKDKLLYLSASSKEDAVDNVGFILSKNINNPCSLRFLVGFLVGLGAVIWTDSKALLLP